MYGITPNEVRKKESENHLISGERRCYKSRSMSLDRYQAKSKTENQKDFDPQFFNSHPHNNH